MLRRQQDQRPFLKFQVAVSEGDLGRIEAALVDCPIGDGVNLSFAQGLQELLSVDPHPDKVRPVLEWGVDHIDQAFLYGALQISGAWRHYALPSRESQTPCPPPPVETPCPSNGRRTRRVH